MLAIDGLGLGGAEMVVRDLVRFVDTNDFEVCVCCTKELGGAIGEELLGDGLDVFVLPSRANGGVDYLGSVKFHRAVKARGIDIVHTHSMSALFDAAPARLTMSHLKLVHTFHFGNYPLESWRYHLLEGLCARTVDALIAVGHEQRRRIVETYRIPESRIGMIWNGVARSATVADTGFRGRVATGARLLVGTIAKLIEQKGLDDLLRVARHCRDGGLPMQFVIVGEGPLRQTLEEQRHQLGLDDTVVITGWIPNAATTALPAFDVFFQPSRWEAMSVAILEAMANGRAIVATRVGDNPHVLVDGVSGLLVDRGDVDGMARALARAADPALRAALGRAARTRFEEQFTCDFMVRAYEGLYRTLARPS